MKISRYAIIMLAFLAPLFSGCITEDVIRSDNTNVFEIEVNNTDLAPPHVGGNGTNERIQGITYFANETPIQLMVFSHADTPGQNAEIHLFINDTKVSDTSLSPIGVSEEINTTITAIIPRYASYRIEVSNFHHYEWREYRIISGKEGNININTSVSDLKVNKSGDNMTGDLITTANITIGNLNIIPSYPGFPYTTVSLDANEILDYKINGIYVGFASKYFAYGSYDNIPYKIGSDGSNYGLLYRNSSDNSLTLEGVGLTNITKFIDLSLDMNGNNITNCANCANSTDLNLKVNKSGDVMAGNLTLSNTSNVNIQLKATSVNNTAIYGISTNSYGLRGSSIDAYGIYGSSNNYAGIRATSTNSYGIYGSSTNSYGVYGSSTNYSGVRGASTGLYGVYGSSTNLYGIYGVSVNSSGIRGESTNSYGVWASSMYSNDGIYAPNLPNSAQTSAVCFNSSTGNITYNSGLTTCLASTETQKRNIVNLSGSYSASFKNLKPISYNLINSDKLNYGFSAQQVKTVYPELVGYEELYDTILDLETNETIKINKRDGNITGVKYENMVAILTKVIQEQQITINKICNNDPTLCN